MRDIARDLAEAYGLDTYYGKLFTFEGDYLRMATYSEWKESYSQSMPYNAMGYIPITSSNDGGEPVTVFACVIGGPTRLNDI